MCYVQTSLSIYTYLILLRAVIFFLFWSHIFFFIRPSLTAFISLFLYHSLVFEPLLCALWRACTHVACIPSFLQLMHIITTYLSLIFHYTSLFMGFSLYLIQLNIIKIDNLLTLAWHRIIICTLYYIHTHALILRGEIFFLPSPFLPHPSISLILHPLIRRLLLLPFLLWGSWYKNFGITTQFMSWPSRLSLFTLWHVCVSPFTFM